jgi:hypothetical protein
MYESDGLSKTINASGFTFSLGIDYTIQQIRRYLWCHVKLSALLHFALSHPRAVCLLDQMLVLRRAC